MDFASGVLAVGVYQHRRARCSSWRWRRRVFRELAVLRADGYHVAASPLITVTGVASAILAPFGAWHQPSGGDHGGHLHRPGPALRPAPPLRGRRSLRHRLPGGGDHGGQHRGAVRGLPEGAGGGRGGLRAAGFHRQRPAVAMQALAERESALLTFMITASGMTLAGVGSAFWGVVGGMLALARAAPAPAGGLSRLTSAGRRRPGGHLRHRHALRRWNSTCSSTRSRCSATVGDQCAARPAA